MAEARMSNYQLSTVIAGMLRRLTVNGLTRDRDTAEAYIRDLHARLCPQPPARGAIPAAPLPEGQGIRGAPRAPYRSGR